MLSRTDREMILKRKRGLRHLATAAWLFPLLWVGTVLWTWLRFPMMNNPWALHARLSRTGSVGRAELESLAAMTPIVIILFQLLVIAFIWMGIRLLRRENRLVELVEQAHGPTELATEEQ